VSASPVQGLGDGRIHMPRKYRPQALGRTLGSHKPGGLAPVNSAADAPVTGFWKPLQG